LTSADIGVEPETIEANLLRWFKMAELWGAIMLIDEADIYMEERQVQDVKRNHLVAGFMGALEYFKGILFLTTNRVGIFDEAFISRIHVQIYYPDFSDDERGKVWDTFFQKLEEDRETTMRISQATKDYIQSNELLALRWNGREIRNGKKSLYFPKLSCMIQCRLTLPYCSLSSCRCSSRSSRPKGQRRPGSYQIGPHQGHCEYVGAVQEIPLRPLSAGSKQEGCRTG
jgi:hypothetical protein